MLCIKNKIVSNETFDAWMGEKYGGVTIDETDFPIGFSLTARWRSGQDVSIPCRVYRSTEAGVPFHADTYNANMIQYWLDGVWQMTGTCWSTGGIMIVTLVRIQ